MVMLAMTMGDPNPHTTPISTFCFAFRYCIFVGERRYFKFDTQVDNSTFQPIRTTNSNERGVVMSRDPFLIVGPYLCLRNG